MARHASLADQLTALRAYATQPDHEPEPMQTNWTVVPANDNDPEDIAELKHDRKRLVTPSVAEIMKNVASGEIQRSEATTEMATYNGVEHKIHNVPGPVVRIGRLRFSDGTQTEKAYRFTLDGKLEEYAARMPTGAMLGCVDQTNIALGGEENPQDVTDTNNYFADMFGTRKPRYVTGRRFKGTRIAITHDEAKAELAKAYANTDMSKVTFMRYPDGLPCGSAKIADSFLGMQKTTCAGGGSMMWQDIVTAMADRKEWLDAVDALKDDDRKALDAAATAKNMAEVGASFGYSGKRAERRGKRALIAANDNLMAAVRKLSA
ncbi:hypothetical protein G6L15_06755 [Agrobacterium rhizogenes]|uniref:hypothetical protein n=1 Tax=Rhizobium rhizogenes TaxID=359 RepID=UPI00157394FD|nr:hypothetical protein [Rhizobium rhizogenes]NTG85849.1 hypothetical protein [Rhizobium rhizogenes]